jgi:hypothetical protein
MRQMSSQLAQAVLIRRAAQPPKEMRHLIATVNSDLARWRRRHQGHIKQANGPAIPVRRI